MGEEPSLQKDFNPLLATALMKDVQISLFRQAFKNSGSGMMITDAQSRIISVNDALIKMSGFSETELYGKKPAIFSSGRQTPEFYRNFWETLQRSGHWEGEIWNQKKDKTVYPVLLSITRIRDSSTNEVFYSASYTNLTQVKLVEKQLNYLASHDAVTGLPNRVWFQAKLDELITENEAHTLKFGLFGLNVRRFKSISDSLGREIGDKLLNRAAERLEKLKPESSILACNSGHEFLILAFDIENAGECIQIANRIIEGFLSPFIIDEHEIYLSLSAGISIFPDDATNSKEILRNVAHAVSRAKMNGTNNHEFFQEDMNEFGVRQLQLEADLRRAIAENQFILYYQPKWSNKDQCFEGFEALIRWNHPEFGILPPGAFIPLAEMTGLVPLLTDWVLEEAIRQLKLWQPLYPSLRVAVNISAQGFLDEKLPRQIRNLLTKYNVSAENLELEITESLAMNDTEATIAQMQVLKDIGTSLAIDDFGTGYSSLSYLRRFPIDCLKIDRSFIREIEAEHLDNQKTDRSLAASIIGLGHSLGLKVVAEGVETLEQRNYLAAIGCDILQGYQLGKPEPAEVAIQCMKV